VEGLKTYALSKTASSASFHTALQSLFSNPTSEIRVGFVFCERLVNMPVQVIPPMYRMLADELRTKGAVYTHLLFLSRIYRLTAEEEADLVAATPPNKKRKQRAGQQSAGGGTFSFHPEDEYVQKVGASLTYI
jgi:hypothetical protein